MIKHLSLRAKRGNLILYGRYGFFFSFLAMTLCVLFSACGQKDKQVALPANILSKIKMAQVITDIHIAEAEVTLRALPDSTKKGPISFHKIFEKDTITQQQYEESLSFYMDHPEMLNEVYEEVLDELSKMEGNVRGKLP